MASNNIIKIKESFEKKFGKAISVEEVTYIVNVYDFLSQQQHTESTPIVVEETPPIIISEIPPTPIVIEDKSDDGADSIDDEEPRYEIDTDGWWWCVVGKSRTDDPTLVSHLRQYNKKDGWHNWALHAHPATHESKRVRLQYVIKWASTNRCSSLYEEDGRIAESFLKQIKENYAKGLVVNVGAKTTDKKALESAKITELLAKEPVSKITSVYKLWGEYLPTRRTGDIANFFVFNTTSEYESHIAEASPLNAFIKETGLFKFNDYKNIEYHGAQTFTTDEVRSIALCPDRFERGLSYLQRCISGKRLFETINPTAMYGYHNNKLTVNSYRHYAETVLAPKLTKDKQILLRYWLCHNASTASLYYQDS